VSNRKPFWLLRPALVALVLAAFVGCGEDSAGPEDADPAAAAAALEDILTDFVEDNDGLQSTMVFSDAIQAALAGGPAAALATDVLTQVSEHATFAGMRSLRLNLAELGTDAPAKLPAWVLGLTFEYDTLTDQYFAGQRTGAPATGVRFILYAVDPILFQPIVPLQEIGYIDIVDTGTFPTAIEIGLIIVVSGDTLADVVATGTLVPDVSLTLAFSGFFSNGTDEADFEINVAETQTGFGVEFTMSASGASMGFEIGYDDTTGEESFTAFFREGDTHIVFTITDVDGEIQPGSGITFNGTVVALITGFVDEPVITNAEGFPLTEAEIAALYDLFDMMGFMIDIFFGLVEFALFLIFLGVM
jgi:hypothetical protein